MSPTTSTPLHGYGTNQRTSIVAVHGLGSNPAWAWTWEDATTHKKCMWLKDLLPKTLPRARIMAYNHNSAWFRDAPVKSVRVCGEQLLNALDTYRKLPQVCCSVTSLLDAE